MKNPVPISRLINVPISEVWKGEATDFTPWLAEEQNIELLAEELGMKLSVDGVELRVGSFIADIVCTDAVDDTTVLIENQTTPSDHRHLGQICTYAGQLKAKKIIWICERVRDEHREAIDWLNEISNDDHSFYAVEVQAWRIGESAPAPKFEVLAQPAKLTRSALASVKSISSTPLDGRSAKYQKFWANFIKLGSVSINGLQNRSPYTQTWQTVFSRTVYEDAYFEFNAVASPNVVRAECYIGGANSSILFAGLLVHKDEIENEFGEALKWETMRSNNRIAIYKDNETINHELGADSQAVWLAEKLSKLINVIIRVADKLDIKAMIEADDFSGDS